MIKQKRILLIAYYFPPFGGVGTFRWAQLCKYLVRFGHEIDVVTVDWKHTAVDNMSALVDDPNIHIHRIPSGYPHNIKRKDFGCWFCNGVRNKLFLHVIDRYLYPFEEAQKWEKYCLPYTINLIQTKSIDVVIATGPMYSCNTIASKIKKQMQDIKVIQDFRDAWSENESLCRTVNISREEMRNNELYCLKNSDAVVSVTNGLVARFAKKINNVHCITNGYDDDEFLFSEGISPNFDIFTFVHIGTIGSGREECCIKLFEALQKNDFFKFKFVFVGSIPDDIKHTYHELFKKDVVNLIPHCDHRTAIRILMGANASLHFNARNDPTALSTKLLEYIGAKKPVLSINWGGDTAELIDKYSIGCSIDPDRQDVFEGLVNFVNKIKEYVITDELRFSFSYANIAKQYHELIESL